MNEEISTFAAQAFHTDLGDGAISGNVVLTQFTLRFESEATTIVVPLNDVSLRLVPGENEHVVFTSEKAPDWTFRVDDTRILRHRHIEGNTHVRSQVGQIAGRLSLKRAAIVTAIFIASFIVLCLTVFWVADAVVLFSIRHLSPATEKKLGDQEAEEVKKELKVSQDPVLIGKLQNIYAKLRPGLPETNLAVEFHIIEIDIPNAGSIPGHIYVTRGLFIELDTEEQMAGVLAHELGHITQKHIIRQYISDRGPGYVLRTAFGNSGGIMASLAQSSQFVLGRSFAHDYELEADDAGWKNLVKSNINPIGFIDALQKLKDWEDRNHVQEPMMSTHPHTDERINRLLTRYSNLKKKSGYIDMSTLLH